MDKLGKYELVERLAIGGMAELYKARMLGDRGFRKVVAIKKILPQLATDTQFVNMFVDEARITAMLDHPNIVQVFEFEQEHDELYLVMQLVEGLDLFALMDMTRQIDEAMPMELAVFVTHELLDALDYAHTANDDTGSPLGIIHRDISPGNVLLSNRGNVLLTDFGIAWAYQRHQKTEAGKLKGKFGYMSPEQVEGGKLDVRSDLFAAGILLAEMLINRHLFVGQSDFDILLMVRDSNLERLLEFGNHIPIDLMTVLMKALSPRPDDRFQTAAGFREALAEWLFSHRKRVSHVEMSQYIDRVKERIENPDQATDSKEESEPTPQAKGSNVSSKSNLKAPHDKTEHTIPEPNLAVGSGPRDTDLVQIDEALETHVDADFEEQTRESHRSVRYQRISTSSLADEPTEKGDFSQVLPMTLLYGLAARQATGLLMVEADSIAKEAYFQDGHPRFVGSNVKEERLGEFLVAKGTITPDELDDALQMLPHFDNHLIDALISLGFIEPIDALRLLSEQVRAKLIAVCQWAQGGYRWYEGRKTPKKARRLQIDTFEIMGATAMQMDVPVVVDWAKRIRSYSVRQQFSGAPLDRFGLGDAMMRAQVLLENHETTVTNLAGRVHDPAARLEFVRALYLLVNTGLATLIPPSS